MKLSYKSKIALPESISFTVEWKADETVNQTTVDAFVGSLARPKWYEDKEELNPKKDTRMWMLTHRKFVPIDDPFSKNKMRIFQCERCGNGVSESGVDLGHRTDWKTYLKAAGVETPAEARAAYNDLNNLILECRSCNVSHDWE